MITRIHCYNLHPLFDEVSDISHEGIDVTGHCPNDTMYIYGKSVGVW